MNVFIITLLLLIIVIVIFSIVNIFQLCKRVNCLEKLCVDNANTINKFSANLDKIYNHIVSSEEELEFINTNTKNIKVTIDEPIKDKLIAISNKLDAIIVNESGITHDIEIVRQCIIRVDKDSANYHKSTIEAKLNAISNTTHAQDAELAKISSRIDWLYKQSQTKKKSSNKLKTAKKSENNTKANGKSIKLTYEKN